MKFKGNILIVMMMAVVFCGRLFCMPDVSNASGESALDLQIKADLSGISAYVKVQDKLDILSSILNYANGQVISQAVKIGYYDAVKRFDTTARSYNLTKQDAMRLESFYKKLQSSTLIYAGAAADLSSKISHWADRARKAELTPHQRAVQRQKGR